MEMEIMMARLLAEIKTNQDNTDENLKEIREQMRADQELLKEELLAKLQTN
jgi:hypothetical protein